MMKSIRGRNDRETQKCDHQLRFKARSENFSPSFDEKFADIAQDKPNERDQQDDIEVEKPEEEDGINERERAGKLAQPEFRDGHHHEKREQNENEDAFAASFALLAKIDRVRLLV